MAKTAAATRVLLAATLLALAVVVTGIAVGIGHDPGGVGRPPTVLAPGLTIPTAIPVALAVCGLVLTGDLSAVIGFSSFGVLVYYAIANSAALTQPPPRNNAPSTSRDASPMWARSLTGPGGTARSGCRRDRPTGSAARPGP